MSRTQGVRGEVAVKPAFHSPTRILTLLLPAGCLCFAILLGLPGAMYAPDAGQYRLLALGQAGAVPAPFSARILGPAIAGWLGRSTGLGVDRGFLLEGVVCLVALIALIAGLLWSILEFTPRPRVARSSRVSMAVFGAIFLIPFWVDIFHDYYLPDLLHATILAAILVCLFFGQTALAFLLLFPAYLARESTILVAFCLVIACWRRIPLRTASIGALAVIGGGFVSKHFAQGGPASVHGLSGGVYILGKLVWSFFKNGLGLPPWSNTLPECNPIWVMAIPARYHLGAIHQIGVCRPDIWGPGRLLLAWFGIFGLGPAFALALWRKMFLPAPSGPLWGRNASFSGLSTGQLVVFRFCLIYGMMSILMTPLLGASVDRLVEYGWPFYFVVLPWFICSHADLPRASSKAVLALHLLICWLAWLGFHQQSYLLLGLVVLALNIAGYLLIKRRAT